MKATGHSEKSFQEQITILFPRLLNFARNLTKNEESAEDIVQTACEKALVNQASFKKNTRLDSWIYRIIYTNWIDDRRKKKTRDNYIRIVSKERNKTRRESKPGTNSLMLLDIRNMLNQLPDEHRVVIMLVCVEGYSYKEVSGVLGVPQGTIASRVARARNMLIKLMNE